MTSSTWNNRLPLWVFFILTTVVLGSIFLKFSVSGNIIVSDGLGYYAHLRSIMIDRDMQYENEYRDFNPTGSVLQTGQPKTVTGHTVNKYPVGPAILWLPFFLLAHSIALIPGSGIEANGYSSIYHLTIGIGSALYGIAGLALIYHMLTKYFQYSTALVATVSIALASNVYYYLALEPTMSHAMSLFTVTLFLFFSLKYYRQASIRNMIILGGCAALMTQVRPQNILFLTALIPMLYIHLSRAQNVSKDTLILLAVFILSFFIFFGPQLATWKILYGSYILYTYQGETFDFSQPDIMGSLFSFRHGLISWTPIILLSLIGIFLAIRKYPGVGILLLIMFMQQLYVNASWGDWWFGHSYGLRAYINCTPAFSFGISMLITITDKYRKYLYAVLALLVLWNISLVGQYSTGLIPHDDPVTYSEMLQGHSLLMDKIIKMIL